MNVLYACLHFLAFKRERPADPVQLGHIQRNEIQLNSRLILVGHVNFVGHELALNHVATISLEKKFPEFQVDAYEAGTNILANLILAVHHAWLST